MSDTTAAGPLPAETAHPAPGGAAAGMAETEAAAPADRMAASAAVASAFFMISLLSTPAPEGMGISTVATHWQTAAERDRKAPFMWRS